MHYNREIKINGLTPTVFSPYKESELAKALETREGTC